MDKQATIQPIISLMFIYCSDNSDLADNELAGIAQLSSSSSSIEIERVDSRRVYFRELNWVI